MEWCPASVYVVLRISSGDVKYNEAKASLNQADWWKYSFYFVKFICILHFIHSSQCN